MMLNISNFLWFSNQNHVCLWSYSRLVGFNQLEYQDNQIQSLTSLLQNFTHLNQLILLSNLGYSSTVEHTCP